MGFLSFILIVVALVLLIPALVLCVQCVLGATSPDLRLGNSGVRQDDAGTRTFRVAVLMPAHNEGEVAAAAVRSVVPQLHDGDRVVVVADNCTDDTAVHARDAGAEVTERTDPDRRGKGWALDHGVRFLEADPPEVVVLMDSDCIAGDGSIDVLARRAVAEQRPMQSSYRLLAPATDADAGRAARFAWRLKNSIRCAGSARLGLPCQLAGSGMSFPWSLIKEAPLASSDLVEDLKLGLDMADAGVAPRFAADAIVDSELPPRDEAQASQKERWVQGHLKTIASRALPMIWKGIRTRDRERVALALDLAVPPFGLLVMLLVAGAAVSLLFAIVGAGVGPLLVFLAGLSAAVGGVLFAWYRAGRDLVSPRELLGFATGLLRKIPLYAGVLVKRQTSWVRTERGDK